MWCRTSWDWNNPIEYKSDNQLNTRTYLWQGQLEAHASVQVNCWDSTRGSYTEVAPNVVTVLSPPP
jgi:hypothetical protein